jgi:hypothetical protein
MGSGMLTDREPRSSGGLESTRQRKVDLARKYAENALRLLKLGTQVVREQPFRAPQDFRPDSNEPARNGRAMDLEDPADAVDVDAIDVMQDGGWFGRPSTARRVPL